MKPESNIRKVASLGDLDDQLNGLSFSYGIFSDTLELLEVLTPCYLVTGPHMVMEIRDDTVPPIRLQEKSAVTCQDKIRFHLIITRLELKNLRIEQSTF